MPVQIITASVVDWMGFLNLLKEADGRNPISAVDDVSRTQEVGDIHKYLLSITSCLGESKLAAQAKVSMEALNFYHLTMAFTVTRSLFEHFILTRSPMHWTSLESRVEGERIYLCHGSMYEWYNLITMYLTPRSSTETRRVLNSILLQFELAGLTPLFSKWRKVSQKDQTFTLEMISDN